MKSLGNGHGTKQLSLVSYIITNIALSKVSSDGSAQESDTHENTRAIPKVYAVAFHCCERLKKKSETTDAYDCFSPLFKLVPEWTRLLGNVFESSQYYTSQSHKTVQNKNLVTRWFLMHWNLSKRVDIRLLNITIQIWHWDIYIERVTAITVLWTILRIWFKHLVVIG